MAFLLRPPRHSHIRRLTLLTLFCIVLTTLFSSLYRWLTLTVQVKPSRVLVGVFCQSEDVEMRSLIRSTYLKFHHGQYKSSSNFKRHLLEHVDVKFIVAQPNYKSGSRDEVRKLNKLVKWERESYDDVVVINMPENKNEGKTPKFFVQVDEEFPEYDYVMKTDLHTFVNLPALATILHDSPRHHLYMGRSINRFMSGTGYILSKDLVHFIRKFSTAQEVGLEGVEDELMGRWLDAGGLSVERVDLGDRVMDRPGYGGPWGLEKYRKTKAGKELVMVHQVRGQEAWLQATKYFIDDGEAVHQLR